MCVRVSERERIPMGDGEGVRGTESETVRVILLSLFRYVADARAPMRERPRRSYHRSLPLGLASAVSQSIRQNQIL